MSYNIAKHTLTYSNSVIINFEYPILETLEIDGILILLLDVPNQVQYYHNVFAFDLDGLFLWQIGDVDLFYTGGWCAFISCIINAGNELVLFNWCDTAVIVNPKTGDVISRYPTK